jgi:dipeptidyl aminopeptidase/acylaminoacyl peptidase
VVVLYGPTDLIQFASTPGYESHARSNSPESKLLGGDVLEQTEKANQANPITYVDQDDPPFLIIHGSKDRTVPINQSESMHKTLQKVGVQSRLHVIEGAGHGGPEFGKPEILKMKKSFLIETVGSE